MVPYKPNGRRLADIKRKVTLFTLLFFFVVSLFFVSANNTNAQETMINRSWQPIGSALPDKGTEPSLDIEQDSIDAEPTITFTFAGTWIDEIMVDNEQFRQLRVPGYGATGEIGQPEMPFKGIFLEIPYGVDVELQILNQEAVSLRAGPKIYPRQKPMPDMSDADIPPFAIDTDAYAADQWFPCSPIEVEAPAFIREKRVVFVKIFPMSYNPGTGELIAFKNLSFKLIWRGEIDPTESEQKDRLRSKFFDSMAQKLIKNYIPGVSPEVDAVNDTAAEYIPTQNDNEIEETFETDTDETSETRTDPDLSTTNAADYLIIVYDSFADEILPLANWKNRMGYMTRVVNMSTVGTTYTDVMNYIQNAYDTWNPAPSFVLLVGDYNQVPSHNAGITHPYHGTSNWPTDHIYACTAGSDYFADLEIGRLSVGTGAECTTVVDKILEYERTPDTGTWWDDALIAALFQDRDGTDGTADRWFMETATHILDYLDGTVGYDIETAQCTDYWPLEYTTFHYRSSSYPHRPTPPDPVPTAVVNRWTSASQSTTDATTAINGGVGLVLHRDHGGYTGWGEPPYYVSHVNALTNGDMTPVVFSMNCLTGGFDYGSGDCFAEAFQKKSGGGASGVVAATRVSYSGYNDLIARGIFDSFWDGYDTSYSATNTWRLAEALNYAKYYMYTHEGSGTYTQVEFYLFHWFGDPSMMMRTVSPQTLTVSHDANIDQSATSFTVNVAQNGALVALEQDGNVLGTATSSGGSATVSISGSLSTSIVYVTVTNHDYLPYEGTVTVGESQSNVALFMDGNPWDFDLAGFITARGIGCTVYNSSDMGVVDLSPYDKVITASVQGNTFWNALEANRAWFETYAASGGVLEMHLCAYSGSNSPGKVYPGGFVFNHTGIDEVSIADAGHPVVNDPNTVTDADLDGWGYSAHGWFTQNPPAEVLYYPVNNEPVFAEDVDYGAGIIFATTQTVEWRAGNTYPEFLENMLYYNLTSGDCNPFTENFDDGVANNWVTDGSGTWAVTSGVYRMTGTTPASSTVRYTYYNGDSADFAYEAKVRKTSGSTGGSMGMIYRSSDGAANNNAYIFHINAEGSYTYYKYVGGVLDWLAGNWISHAAINTGFNVWNTLKVVANGTQFDLYCNGALLTSFTDSSLSSGKPGLKAYDTNSNSDVVEFDDVLLTCTGGPGDELAADFGSSGLYHYDNGTWAFLTGSNSEDMVAGGRDLYVDFGGSGLYKYDGTWAFLTGSNSEDMVAVDTDLYVDFGTSGLYKYDGTWTWLTGSNSEDMVAVGTDLYVDFGSGLYKYDGTWAFITGANAEDMVAVGTDLYVDFGASGLYKYDGTWTFLTGNTEDMVAVGSDLYVDFGSSGLYKYDGTWTLLTGANSEDMVAVGTDLYVDFGGSGLYKYDGTWTLLTGANPEDMIAVDLN